MARFLFTRIRDGRSTGRKTEPHSTERSSTLQRTVPGTVPGGAVPCNRNLTACVQARAAGAAAPRGTRTWRTPAPAPAPAVQNCQIAYNAGRLALCGWSRIGSPAPDARRADTVPRYTLGTKARIGSPGRMSRFSNNAPSSTFWPGQQCCPVLVSSARSPRFTQSCNSTKTPKDVLNGTRPIRLKTRMSDTSQIPLYGRTAPVNALLDSCGVRFHLLARHEC